MSPTKKKCELKLIAHSHAQVEGRNVGKVDTETYRVYARAWGAFYILPILMLLLAVTERSFYGLQNWWLSVWSNANAATVVSWRRYPAACVLAMSLYLIEVI